MGARILVADDSVTIQKVVELTFSKEDFEIISARNGEEAIRKARESRPDLMLIDVVMPGKTGYEVCEALRLDPLFKEVPVILLTGTFEAFDKEEALRVGVSDFVTKPFESQALISKVRQLLFAASVKAQARAAMEPVPLPPKVAAPPPSAKEVLPVAELEVKEPLPVPEVTPLPVEPVFEIPKEEVAEEKVWELLELSVEEAAPSLGLLAQEPQRERGVGPAIESFEQMAAELGIELGPEAIPQEPMEVEAKEEEFLVLEPLEEVPALGLEMEIFPEKGPRVEDSRWQPGTLLETPLLETPSPPAVAPEAAVSLTPDAIAGIAEKVAEGVTSRVVQEVCDRLVERIEKVVWEVVPDLAEMLITKEIERIKATIEGKESV
ncbi:MAG: response regulator [candidate division NC10 bacterium]|nr:response regulator [candidate division NC10 bacterium]